MNDDLFVDQQFQKSVATKLSCLSDYRDTASGNYTATAVTWILGKYTYPTDLITIAEPQNPSIGASELHIIIGSADFEAFVIVKK